MRIIAGDKRGASIEAPKNHDTRPTLDRVRESIFGMIQFDIADRVVLDLFAGSGAMGLEALSRYAKFAVLADSSREAVSVIGRNIQKLGYGDRTRVYNCDYKKALYACAAEGRRFNMVFLDPPYEYGLAEPAINTMSELKLLCSGALIVAEYSLAKPVALPAGFCVRSMKKYGEIGVSVIVKDVEA